MYFPDGWGVLQEYAKCTLDLSFDTCSNDPYLALLLNNSCLTLSYFLTDNCKKKLEISNYLKWIMSFRFSCSSCNFFVMSPFKGSFELFNFISVIFLKAYLHYYIENYFNKKSKGQRHLYGVLKPYPNPLHLVANKGDYLLSKMPDNTYEFYIFHWLGASLILNE